MSLKIHYLEPPDREALDYLKSRLSAKINITTSADGDPPLDTDILIGGRPKREELVACKRLRAVIIPWAGLPHKTRELLADFPDLSVHNLHYNAIPVAEMALALLLAAAKYILPFDRAMRKNDWTARYEDSSSMLLDGKSALILGYGAIGRRVAKVCRELGLEVLGVRRQPDGREANVYPLEALPELLTRSNALIICLPHTSQTDGLIGAKELALMPRGSILVNVGRGAIVVEEALYQALRSGHLYAAGLDVWYNYPPDEESRKQTPPANFPFHELDNVIMSPHRADSTTESSRLCMEHLAILLNAAASDEKMPNIVDIKQGY